VTIKRIENLRNLLEDIISKGSFQKVLNSLAWHLAFTTECNNKRIKSNANELTVGSQSQTRPAHPNELIWKIHNKKGSSL